MVSLPLQVARRRPAVLQGTLRSLQAYSLEEVHLPGFLFEDARRGAGGAEKGMKFSAWSCEKRSSLLHLLWLAARLMLPLAED